MRQACQQVGVAQGGKIADDPRFQMVLAEERAKNAEAAKVRREDIIEGLKEAIQLAKMVSDPHALIKAWAELGRFCGFYAPEIKKLDISLTSKRVISQLESLSEAELLRIANDELAESGGLAGHFRARGLPILDVTPEEEEEEEEDELT